jgi:hypothetical protein
MLDTAYGQAYPAPRHADTRIPEAVVVWRRDDARKRVCVLGPVFAYTDVVTASRSQSG